MRESRHSGRTLEGGGNGNAGKKNYNSLYLRFQTARKKRVSKSIKIPDWLFEDLCKIQAAWGIPLEFLVTDQLGNFISDFWDFENDKPKRIGGKNGSI